MDMVDVTTCKFVGDASLNNDSIHSLCDLLNFANISNGANLQLPLDTQKQTGIQLRGALPPDPHRGLCPLDSRWGLRPQTPVIGSRSALAMEFQLCAVLN